VHDHSALPNALRCVRSGNLLLWAQQRPRTFQRLLRHLHRQPSEDVACMLLWNKEKRREEGEKKGEKKREKKGRKDVRNVWVENVSLGGKHRLPVLKNHLSSTVHSDEV
jgi:hypothetical protein